MHLGSYDPDNQEFSMSQDTVTPLWAVFLPYPILARNGDNLTAGTYRLSASTAAHKY